VTTTRADGDLAVTGAEPGLTARRRAVVDLPWTWLTQVHGADVVTVTRPGEHAGVPADAAVTAVPGAALAVTTADCVPVVLVADGAVGVAHAGWKGLLGGVVGNTAAALAALGHPPTRAVIGPCIRPERYEFGAADLDAIAARWGDDVRATTAAGTPALDVAAGVRRALAEVGITDVIDDGTCTAAAADTYWSYRARQEPGRIATVAWLEDDA
jgi:YfiH family protein